MNKKFLPNPGFPLHRLHSAQTKAWLLYPNTRPFTANLLAKKYGGSGVGLLSATLRLFVLIQPTGRYIEVAPPWKKYEMWQVANAPNPVSECACRNYIDPEVGGPWSERDGKHGHHPLCQFTDTSGHVFDLGMKSAVHRVEQGLTPQVRPDEWLRMQKEIKNS